MQFRKARYINSEKTQIDMELQHPVEGWIPITINEAEYPLLWPQVVATNPVFDAEFQEQARAEEVVLRRGGLTADRSDFCIALRNLGVIDQQWAVHAAQGNLPTSLHGAIVSGGLDISMEDASIKWASMTTVSRHHPFVEAIRKHKNLTPVQMDEYFN